MMENYIFKKIYICVNSPVIKKIFIFGVNIPDKVKQSSNLVVKKIILPTVLGN